MSDDAEANTCYKVIFDVLTQIFNKFDAIQQSIFTRTVGCKYLIKPYVFLIEKIYGATSLHTPSY
jgi:hypothetical protein